MAYMIVRHKVDNYDIWKAGYDEHGATRKAAGSKGTHVFRTDEDPNELLVLLEWDSLDNARKFAGSQDLRETMQKLGVNDHPDIYFLNDAGRTSE